MNAAIRWMRRSKDVTQPLLIDHDDGDFGDAI
jgi:hypothetical protein